MHIGQNISAIRRQMKLTQGDFAGKLGVSKATVSLWENQKKYPSRKNFTRILTAFKLNAKDFFELDPDDPILLQHPLPFPPIHFRIKDGIDLHVQNEKLSQRDAELLPKAVQMLKLFYS